MIRKVIIKRTKEILILKEKMKWKKYKKGCWKNISGIRKIKHSGVISNILQNNKSGFIKNEKGSYFFRISEIKDKSRQDLQGKKVYFYLETDFDRKKNMETEVAVNIKFIGWW